MMSSSTNYYVPPHFRESDDQEILNLVRKHNFAQVVSTNPNSAIPFVSKIPLMLLPRKNDAEIQSVRDFEIVGHVSTANVHWKIFDSHPDQPALVIFSGPHSYISPSWYLHHDVPTWNYAEVRITGKPQLIQDRDQQRHLLGALVEQEERNMPSPWKLSTLDDEKISGYLKRIKVFRISVDTVEAKFKLSQNQPQEDRNSIVKTLLEEGFERDTGELMKRLVLERAVGNGNGKN